MHPFSYMSINHSYIHGLNAGYEYMTKDGYRWNNTTLQFCRSNRYGQEKYIYTQVLWESELMIRHRQCQLHAGFLSNCCAHDYYSSCRHKYSTAVLSEWESSCVNAQLIPGLIVNGGGLGTGRLGNHQGNHLDFLQWLMRYTTGESSTAPLL